MRKEHWWDIFLGLVILICTAWIVVLVFQSYQDNLSESNVTVLSQGSVGMLLTSNQKAVDDLVKQVGGISLIYVLTAIFTIMITQIRIDRVLGFAGLVLGILVIAVLGGAVFTDMDGYTTSENILGFATVFLPILLGGFCTGLLLPVLIRAFPSDRYFPTYEEDEGWDDAPEFDPLPLDDLVLDPTLPPNPVRSN